MRMHIYGMRMCMHNPAITKELPCGMGLQLCYRYPRSKFQPGLRAPRPAPVPGAGPAISYTYTARGCIFALLASFVRPLLQFACMAAVEMSTLMGFSAEAKACLHCSKYTI